jgi:hypothetical protein
MTFKTTENYIYQNAEQSKICFAFIFLPMPCYQNSIKCNFMSLVLQKITRMKKSAFLRLLYSNTSVPVSIINRICIGLNKNGLLPKGSHHKDPDLNWKQICLIIYSTFVSPTTVEGIIDFAKKRKDNQVEDDQILGGILEALTNANDVKMVFISHTNIIVMKQKENLFFGYATTKQMENLNEMVMKAYQVPGFVFQNLAAGIVMDRSAILN